MHGSPAPSGSPADRIRPKGPRLVMANAHLLTEEGLAKIAGGASALTIDLAEIEFLDSSGIGALIGLKKRIPDGQINLMNVGGFVATVLQKTQTARLFQILN